MLSFFPRGVLDEIWDLIESVSEGFLIYSEVKMLKVIEEVVVRLIVVFMYSSLMS